MIALETPKCIPVVGGAREEAGVRESISQFQTGELASNPFMLFNFFYRYTSNAPRFARPGAKEQKKNIEKKASHPALLPELPSAQIEPLRKKDTGRQRVIAVCVLEGGLKVLSVKERGQPCRILFYTKEESSERSSQVMALPTDEEEDENFQTIVTDQVNAFGSPKAQPVALSHDWGASLLIVDEAWLLREGIVGFSSLVDVERKIERFTQLANDRGYLKQSPAPIPKKRRLLSQ